MSSISETQRPLPKIISLFPGIEDRVYFQNPDTLEYWFHASNICKVLGYSNPSSALALHCDDDEKFREVHSGRDTWFVSEAGCYGLAMGAKNEVASKFKRWLKHEVLPKLRAEGGYIMPSATLEQIEGLQNQLDYQKSLVEGWENHIDRIIAESTNLEKLIDLRPVTRGIDLRLAVGAHQELCGFAHFAIDYKPIVQQVAHFHSPVESGEWQSVNSFKSFLNDVAGIYVPRRILTAWLSEMGFETRPNNYANLNTYCWEVRMRRLGDRAKNKAVNQFAEVREHHKDDRSRSHRQLPSSAITEISR